jgi:hypothetical protein
MPEDPETPDPNRKPPVRTVVQGRASFTALGWGLWTLTFVLAVLVTVLDRKIFWGAAAIVALGALSILLLVRRAARRVQWVLLLDDDRLSIERVPPLGVDAIELLDVGAGVQLDVVPDKRTLRFDAAVALQTTGRRALWSPRIRPARAISQLVTFLRTNGIPVTLPPDVPIGWFPPDYPPT